VAAGTGEPDRAIAALQKLLSIQCSIRFGMIRASKNSARKSSRDRTVAMMRAGAFAAAAIVLIYSTERQHFT
jgi:hypothetical protein